MTTLSVVKKGGELAIAADGLTTFGDTRLARCYKGEHDKILAVAGSWIGICGSSARIAEAGVAAGIEFDTSSGPPIMVHEIKLEGKPNE